MLPSASSWNVELMLAKDTSFVERLPGEASTRSVGCEGSACTAPTVETDVLPGTPNMCTTAVLSTSVSKRVLVVSTGPARRYAVAVSQASPNQPQIQSFRTILPVVDVLACLLLDAFLSSTAALVMPRLPRVLRTVLPGAVEDSQGACLVLSGQGPALVPG